MKKDKHPIDDFFRESLEEYKVTPSSAARNRFLDATSGAGSKGSTGQYRWYYFISAAVLVISAVLLYFMTINHSGQLKEITGASVNINSQMAEPSAKPAETTISSPVLNPETHTKIKTTTNNASPKRQAKSKIISTRPESNTPEPKVSVVSDVSKVSTFSSPYKSAITGQETILSVDKNESEVINNAIFPPPVKKESPAENNLQAEPEQTNVKPAFPEEANAETVNKPIEGMSPAKSPDGNPILFTPLLKYDFEWVFDKKNDYKINTLGFEGQLQRGKFYVKAGVGLSITEASDNVSVQYNDYLGSYQKLDSLTFSWDEKHYYLLPAYHMTDKKVWDSAVRLDSYQIKKQYRLIQIPVMFGYTFLQHERFILGVNAGANVSFYLNSKKLSGEYSTGQNRVIEMNPVTADLRRTNWYFISNLQISYKLFEGISLDLGPEVKYLINPSDARKNEKQNILIPGIRASLKIKL
jgi:hypothetical protein